MAQFGPRTDHPTAAAIVLRRLMPASARNILEEAPMQAIATAPEFVVAPEAAEQIAVIDVAADIGNARAVVLVSNGGTTTEISMPTVRSLHAAFSSDVFERRNLPAGSWSKLRSDDHIIQTDAGERFLGKLAIDFGLAISSGRGSDLRYSDGTTRDFILASIAAACPGASQIVARVVTMLPISLYMEHAPAVEQSLKGTHKYGYNGRAITLKIEHVRVEREGAAAFAALPMSGGHRTIGIDIGGRTVNVALFLNGEFFKGATIDNMGVEVALDAVDKELRQNGISALTMGERIELLEAMRQGKGYSVTRLNAAFRVDLIARAKFDQAAAALAQELHTKVDTGAAERVMAFGGGAYEQFFGDTLEDKIKGLLLAEQPETRNVYGALAGLAGVVVKKAKKR